MKLRRRRKEDGNCHCVLYHPQLGRDQSLCFASSLHHFRSLPPPSSTSQHPIAPSLSAATCLESNILQLSRPSCFASPFLLHKIPEATERGGKDRGGAPSLPTQLSYLTITRRAQLAAPLSLHLIGRPRLLFGSNGSPSVADGAIGKQRPKMRFPVSFPSLMNK